MWEEGLAAWVKRGKRGLGSVSDGRGEEKKRREKPHMEKKERGERHTYEKKREKRGTCMRGIKKQYFLITFSYSEPIEMSKFLAFESFDVVGVFVCYLLN